MTEAVFVQWLDKIYIKKFNQCIGRELSAELTDVNLFKWPQGERKIRGKTLLKWTGRLSTGFREMEDVNGCRRERDNNDVRATDVIYDTYTGTWNNIWMSRNAVGSLQHKLFPTFDSASLKLPLYSRWSQIAIRQQGV